jgi:TonB family protein
MRVFIASLVLLLLGLGSSGAVAQEDAAPEPSASMCSTPDQEGRTLVAVSPGTPAQARDISGTVVVLVTLNEKSELTGATISSSPSPLLNDTALAAVRASTFQTAVRNCHPVAMKFRFLVRFGPSAPNAAAGPSISNYFIGTWSCSSEPSPATGVMVFGLNPTGSVLFLSDAYVTAKRVWGAAIQTYTESGAVITVNEKLGPHSFTATSNGWHGDILRFGGLSIVAPGQTVPATATTGTTSERMTYVRTDQDHFSRRIEAAPVDTGPWTTVTNEVCARIASAPRSPSP